MAGNAYWKNRQACLMYGRMDDAEVAAQTVARIYSKASLEINRRMADIVRVYGNRWNLTEKEARDLLDSMERYDLPALRKAAATITDPNKRQKILRDLETPAYQARMRRLEELQRQIDQMMRDVYQQDRRTQAGHYRSMGTDAYYHGIYDVQRQVGFQFSFAHIDQKAFDRLLKSKWSGKNYSDRIWASTRQVADTVKQELMLEMLTGKTLDDCAEAIQRRFQVGAFQSRRLIRTESNFVSGQMQQQAYKECGSDYYEYVATLDSKTDEECGALDGKRFKISEAQPGVNMHPMHPFCRCSTVIALDDGVKADLKRRARDPKTGEQKMVPASTSYEQWAKDNGLRTRAKRVTGPPLKAKAPASTPAQTPSTPAKSDELTERRKRRAEEYKARKGDRTTISFDFKGHDDKFKDARALILQLAAQYQTRLQTVIIGAEKAAGAVQVSGAVMKLNTPAVNTVLHEFGHTIAGYRANKLGLTKDDDFWKEIRTIRRKYMKDVGDDVNRWISPYEHSSGDPDEFFAEAFAHAKMREMGVPIPSQYGSDFTYSQQVLDTVEKYFGRDLRAKTKKANGQPKSAKHIR